MSMMHSLYVLQYAKGTCRAEVMSNREKIEPVALAVIALCLSERTGRQAVSLSV